MRAPGCSWLEQAVFRKLRAHAHAGVLDLEFKNGGVILDGAPGDPGVDGPALLVIAHGVAEQVQQDLPQVEGAAQHPDRLLGQGVAAIGQAGALHQGLVQGAHLAQQVGQVKGDVL